jgi:type II secretory pathway pseudopilin PulG
MPQRASRFDRRPFRGAAGAFTLFELVVVVLILAIAAAVTVPRYADNLLKVRADAAARRVAADLATAQARAKAKSCGQAVTFTVPPSGNRYQLDGVANPDRKSTTYIVDLAQPPYQVALGRVDFGGTTKVTFSGYGLPDRGGTIVVQCGKYTKTVMVDAGTGIATIQ